MNRNGVPEAVAAESHGHRGITTRVQLTLGFDPQDTAAETHQHSVSEMYQNAE